MCPIQILLFEDRKIPDKYREDVQALLEGVFDYDEDSIKFEPEAHTKIIAVDSDDKVVGHLAAYVREVEFENFSSSLGMIGDVATVTQFQRRGIAKKMIESAHVLFRKVGIKHSILFAYNTGVYKSSGYKTMANEVHFLDQDGNWKTFVYRGSMFCELSDHTWPKGLINLKGLAV